MPRLSELSANGYSDLAQAIARLIGDQKETTIRAGLVPYNEWRFFEDQYSLFIELQTYLELYDTPDSNVFPKLADINKNGAITLYNLVQQFGGRKLVAGRLSMLLAPKNKKSTIKQDLQWGSFNLNFAVDLIAYIRENQMSVEPPINVPLICMPTQKELMQEGEMGEHLALKIEEFGGFENVARRLGLVYFDAEKNIPILDNLQFNMQVNNKLG